MSDPFAQPAPHDPAPAPAPAPAPYVPGAFIDVDVTITMAEPGTKPPYTVAYSSASPLNPIPVAQPDTVFRFRLIDPTPASIYFIGMSSTRPTDGRVAPTMQRRKPQMSHFSISLDRRVLICSDAWSEDGKINVTLEWIDGTLFSDDPQVGNQGVPP